MCVMNPVEINVEIKINLMNSFAFDESCLFDPYLFCVWFSDKRCTKFIHPEREDGAIYRLCKGDMCQCAEGIISHK